MTLQDRLLDLLDGVALKPYVLYQALEEPHEAIDAALKGLRQAGEVALVQGRFQTLLMHMPLSIVISMHRKRRRHRT